MLEHRALFGIGIAVALVEILILLLHASGDLKTQDSVNEKLEEIWHTEGPAISGAQTSAAPKISFPKTSGEKILQVPTQLVELTLSNADFDWCDKSALLYKALNLTETQVVFACQTIRDTLGSLREKQLANVRKVTEQNGDEYVLIPSLGEVSIQTKDSLVGNLSLEIGVNAARIISIALEKQTYDFGQTERHLAIINLPGDVPKLNPKSENEYEFEERLVRDSKPGRWTKVGMGEGLFNEMYLEFFNKAVEESRR